MPADSTDPLSARDATPPVNELSCSRRYETCPQPSTRGRGPVKRLLATSKTSTFGKRHGGTRPENLLLDAEKCRSAVWLQRDRGSSR